MEQTEQLFSILDIASILISIVALIISGGVFITHIRRDLRESVKFKLEKHLNTKRVSFASSKPLYEFDQGNFEGEYFEGHFISFKIQMTNLGSPPLIFKSLRVIFQEPLTGKVIQRFSKSFSPNLPNIEKGKVHVYDFGYDFKKEEPARRIKKSSFKIEVTDIDGDVFISELYNFAVGK